MRDAALLKTVYAFGLRRGEACGLDLADFRHNPKVAQFGRFGGLFVRYGKASRGGPPRRRTVLAVPEMGWITEVLRHWVEEVRPCLAPGSHPAVWVTERRGRITVRTADTAFAAARAAAGLAAELDLHCLRHSYVTHLVEFDYPERFVSVLLSPQMGVHDVQHEPLTGADLRGGGGYLPPSITRVPRRFDACSTGSDARLVA